MENVELKGKKGGRKGKGETTKEKWDWREKMTEK